MKRIGTSILALIFSASFFTSANAADNCTRDQKKAANDRLLEIAEDAALQKELRDRHLPFGVHQATGPTANEEVLYQGGFLLSHDRDLRTTLWVGYRLTAEDQRNARGQARKDCFRKDPRIKRDFTATTTDYDEKRFDQGHMANDADMKDDMMEQLNTYMMSNMSPQDCRFNRGIWLSLEQQTRAWATAYNTVYVTSGAIFDRDDDNVRDQDADAERMLSRNGKSRVAVPSHYYKVIVREDDDGPKSIGFLLPHTNDAHGTKWDDVQPHVLATVATLSEIEDKADLTLHPDLDRTALVESGGGEGWALGVSGSNFEGSCKN